MKKESIVKNGKRREVADAGERNPSSAQKGWENRKKSRCGKVKWNQSGKALSLPPMPLHERRETVAVQWLPLHESRGIRAEGTVFCVARIESFRLSAIPPEEAVTAQCVFHREEKRERKISPVWQIFHFDPSGDGRKNDGEEKEQKAGNTTRVSASRTENDHLCKDNITFSGFTLLSRSTMAIVSEFLRLSRQTFLSRAAAYARQEAARCREDPIARKRYSYLPPTLTLRFSVEVQCGKLCLTRTLWRTAGREELVSKSVCRFRLAR